MIRNDLYLQRAGAGIELLPPDLLKRPTSTTLGDFMRLPVNVYLMDRDSIMQHMNDQTAETSGYLSAEDAIGKSIRDVSKAETIQQILANDQQVVKSGSYLINTESYLRPDGAEMMAVSIKLPWLENNAIRGIFGCSILLHHPQASVLGDVLRVLLPTTAPTTAMGTLGCTQVDGVLFDERDHNIMYWLVRGNTAKQIARHLGLSHRTIEHRLESIKNKLGVTSKSELIARLIEGS